MIHYLAMMSQSQLLCLIWTLFHRHLATESLLSSFSLYFQLHTSELNDGYDWGRLNLQSVTEQSSMDDFLATAELAGTEFVAGK